MRALAWSVVVMGLVAGPARGQGLPDLRERTVSRAVVGADGVWRWVESPAEIPEVLAEAKARADLLQRQARDPLQLHLVDPAEFDIPIDLHERVKHWMEHYIGDGRRSMARWLARGARFQPMMREALAAAGLPEDLVYVSLIESGYEPLARSRTGAAGLWQFVPSTGHAQGLRIDGWVDERYDPEASLHAAISYLDELHRDFGDWRLAWAAYNAGPGRVQRAISNARSHSYWKLVSRGQFSTETDEYVAKIMAAAIIGKHPERYGFGGVEPKPVLAYATVEIEGSVGLDVLARKAGVSVTELKVLNPALRRGATPPQGWQLRVPVGSEAAFAPRIAGD